ncbi:MAG: rhodanese-like domain-containing protein [Candidatus Dasytiphilus stammeri]
MQNLIQLYTIHPTLCIIWIILLILLIISNILVLFNQYTFINCTEATLLINKQDAKVIDIRSNDEYYQTHIPNSINILASEIKHSSYIIQKLQPYKNYPIIIVGSGINKMEDTEIASKLNQLKFQKVYILESGLIDWNKENLPLIKRETLK